MRLRYPLFTLALLSIVACSTHGTYVEEEQAQQVAVSVKTAKELADALGTPSVTIPMGNGTTMWVYEGVYATANAAGYIPYLNIFLGRNNQKCTRLTAIVDDETGEVSDVQYETKKDSDFWARNDDSCDDSRKKPSNQSDAEVSETTGA